MDVITAEKLLLALKYGFLHCLSLHCIIFFFFSLLLSSKSLWFPSMNRLVDVVVESSFLSPTWLFVVVNVIIVYIVGELKLTGAKPSPANEMYEHCVQRSRNLRDVIEYGEEEQREEDDETEKEEEREEEEEEQREEENEGGMEDEELNKRADALIARVNKQRRIEAMQSN